MVLVALVFFCARFRVKIGYGNQITPPVQGYGKEEATFRDHATILPIITFTEFSFHNRHRRHYHYLLRCYSQTCASPEIDRCRTSLARDSENWRTPETAALVRCRSTNTYCMLEYEAYLVDVHREEKLVQGKQVNLFRDFNFGKTARTNEHMYKKMRHKTQKSTKWPGMGSNKQTYTRANMRHKTQHGTKRPWRVSHKLTN